MKFIVLTCLFSLVLNGCSQQINSNFPNQSEVNPIDEFTVPDVLPTPKLGTGGVFGIIDSKNLLDLKGNLVYLGELVELPDNMFGAFLNTKVAPNSLVDSTTGKFYVSDVLPGKYSLIIYEVMMGGQVYKNADDSAIVIEIKENEITNIGNIPYPLNN